MKLAKAVFMKAYEHHQLEKLPIDLEKVLQFKIKVVE